MQAYPTETLEQWNARLANNRRHNIEAEADPLRKAELEAIDRQCKIMDAFCDKLSTAFTKPTSEEAANA